MKEKENILSIFIDESGDFGPFDKHSPLYIFSLVIHEQNSDISKQLTILENKLIKSNMPKNHFYHIGPMIRREGEYTSLNIEERRRLLNHLALFIKNVDIKYKTFIFEKKFVKTKEDLLVPITKQFTVFLKENLQYLQSFNKVILYYDYGQSDLGRMLLTLFNAFLNNFEFRRVSPVNYRLFQVADYICTIELVDYKKHSGLATHSENQFFYNKEAFKKSYLQVYRSKKLK